MKILDRIALMAFSIMMLVISIIVCSLIFGWLNLTTVYLVANNVLASKTSCNIIIGTNIVFIILAIKAIFFESVSSEDARFSEGVLLENDDGKLLITRETLIGIVNAVLSEFKDIENPQTKVYLDDENNLSILVTVETKKDVIIKDLSNDIQIKIKDKIKKSLDLNVKSIDIRIKSIVEPTKSITKN